jgi:uncharacterized protein YbjT (DUF2867 family)
MIVVTTPTGKIGSELVPRLLAAGESIRVIVRDPEKLAPQLLGKVDVAKGSTDDPGVLSAAFEGAEAVFLVVPFPFNVEDIEEYYARFIRPAAEAVKRHAVKRLVFVSGLRSVAASAVGGSSFSTTIEDTMADTGSDYRALWCAGFMENLLGQIEPLRRYGTFSLAARPDVKAPLVAARDIAATASRLLLDRSWRGRGGVAVMGPEDLSYNDMAQIMSEVLGKPIRFRQISDDAFMTGFVQAGGSRSVAQWLVEMRADSETNPHGSVARTAENTTPFSFREWCEAVLKPAVQG